MVMGQEGLYTKISKTNFKKLIHSTDHTIYESARSFIHPLTGNTITIIDSTGKLSAKELDEILMEYYLE